MTAMNQHRFQQASREERPVLVEFWAPWCVYCRRITPALQKVADQYRDTLVVGKVNIDEEPELSRAERIEVVPTLILYQNGEALGSIVAPDSKARIDEFIQDTLGM